MKGESYIDTRFFDVKKKKMLFYDKVSVEKMKGVSKYEY